MLGKLSTVLSDVVGMDVALILTISLSFSTGNSYGLDKSLSNTPRRRKSTWCCVLMGISSTVGWSKRVVPTMLCVDGGVYPRSLDTTQHYCTRFERELLIFAEHLSTSSRLGSTDTCIGVRIKH